MPDVSPAASLLFLREEELRLGLELLFFAQRDLDDEVDKVLAQHGLARAHHRIIHFVGRQPAITMGALLGIVSITKQSLGRLVGELVDKGLIVQRQGVNDRRQRQISLTEDGRTLERQLWERLRIRIAKSYRDAGPEAVEGFRKVLVGLVESAQDRRRFERSPATGAR